MLTYFFTFFFLPRRTHVPLVLLLSPQQNHVVCVQRVNTWTMLLPRELLSVARLVFQVRQKKSTHRYLISISPTTSFSIRFDVELIFHRLIFEFVFFPPFFPFPFFLFFFFFSSFSFPLVSLSSPTQENPQSQVHQNVPAHLIFTC